MRIAFIYRGHDPYLNNRAKYLIKNGHSVYYFVMSSENNQAVPQGVSCIHMVQGVLSQLRIIRWCYARSFSRMYIVGQLTQKYRIDILHIINMAYSKYALFSKSKKVIIHNEGSDVLLYPRLKQGWRLRALYRFFYRFADAVVQDSKISQEAGLRYGAPVSNNEVIEIGVDFRFFNIDVETNVARQRLGMSETQKLVFCSRSFTKTYAIDVIIKTIPLVKKQFPDVRFVFCALRRDLEGEFKRLAEVLDVTENAIFLPVLDNERELPFLCKDADVVVSVPSSDSSPMSVYEAMACGTPVIISDLPWYREKFENNREVITVPVGDVDKLASVILDVLEGRKAIDIESSYNKVYKYLNQETENQKLVALYQKVLQE